ncbi:DivIVA domain-containing protein, partial [Actinomadura adrarensis]
MPLTPADVRNKQFSTTRLRPGYDEEEVDAFLDEVEAELDRLIQENEELRAKLAECLRGKVPAMAAPIVEPKPDVAQIPEPP